MEAKICLFCKYFYLDPGHPGYSDITPGWDMVMQCSKGHWKFTQFETTTEEYRKMLLKADKCNHFEEVRK